jgi:SAM-dependent methyltransferase
MPSLWVAARSVWRGLVPSSLKRSTLGRKLKNRFYKSLPHDTIYNREYFQRDIEVAAVRSAGPIATSILAEWKPSSVVDVGCGTGALLEALRGGGCRVFGLEYADAGLEFCRQRNLDVQKFDIERSAIADYPKFDVAISLEVAEHLPESSANRFVGLLAGMSNRIVFTAAHPGQGGTDHVNEQPESYWIAKFGDHGFAPDFELRDRWKKHWAASGQVAGFYIQNLMIFKKTSG